MTKEELKKVTHNLQRGWIIRFIEYHNKKAQSKKINRQVVYRALKNQNSKVFIEWQKWAAKEIDRLHGVEKNLLQKVQ